MSAQEATMTAPGTRRPGRRVLPRRTVRMRLTVLYGALFLLSGAVLLAITSGVGCVRLVGAAAPDSAAQGGTQPRAARGGARARGQCRTQLLRRVGRSRWAS